MDTIYWVLIAVAVVTVVVTLTVVLKRGGEKVQNDLHSDSQQKVHAIFKSSPVSAEQVQQYLAAHESDHNDITLLFTERQGEFDIYIETGRGVPSLLLERLYQLSERIDLQINEDDEWMERFSSQERQKVADHHREWRRYQANVQYMIRQLS